MMSIKRLAVLLLRTASVLVITQSVFAGDVTWVGSGDGTWQEPDADADWSAQYNSGDNVTFNDTAATTNVSGGTVNPASMIVTNDTKNFAVSAAIAGACSLTKAGTGTLTLSGINTFTGNTYINGGTTRVSAQSGLGAVGGDVFFAGGALQVTGGFTANSGKIFGVGTSTGTLNIDTNQTLILGSAGNLTAGSAGTLIKSGSGTLEIGGANNGFDGLLRLDDGILKLRTSIAVVGDGTSRATLTMNGGNVIITNNSATFAINSLLNVAADATVTHGRGVASSTTYAKSFYQTTLGGFTLRATTDGLLSSPGIATLDLNAVTLDGNATLNVVNNTDGTTNRILVGVVTDNGYRLTLKGDGDFAQDADWAAGAGGLTLHEDYSGTATLNQWPNGFTGGVTINGGTLAVAVNAHSTFGTNAVTLNGGALAFRIAGATIGDTLDFQRDTTVGGNATIISDRTTAIGGRNYQLGILTIGAHTFTVEGGMTASGTAGLIFDSTTLTGSPTFNIVNPVAGGITMLTPNVISDGGNDYGITKLGAGTLKLSGGNTYTGPTIVMSGVLQLTTVSSLPVNTDLYIYTGATNNMAFTGTNTIHTLYIDGVAQPVGSYGASTPGMEDFIIGNGYLQTTAVPSGCSVYRFR